MKRLILIMLTACTDDAEPGTCGQRPVFPGYAVSFEADHAVMSSADFQRLEAWRADIELYAECLEAR